MDEREKLLKRIQMADFAIVEAAQYLDTHPEDAQALGYYHKYRDMRKEAMEEFEQTYGPLSIYGNSAKTSWKWSKTPWPWEMEE